jgi:hypothetical protein
VKRVPVLVAFALALAASPAWAYGRYQHIDTTGMVLETLPPFIKIILMSLIPYLVCSVWMDRAKAGIRVLPLMLDLAVAVLWVMPEMYVLGEFGPVHVAMHAASPSCILFPGLLVAKFVVLCRRAARAQVPMATLAPAK